MDVEPRESRRRSRSGPRPLGRRPLPAAVATAAVLAVSACGGDDPTEPAPRADVATVEVATSTGSSADTLAALEETVRLEATARDADGDPVPGVEVTWSVSDEAVAVVDDEGTVTAVGNGEAEVTASVGEASGTATVAVAQAAATVTVTPSPAVLTSVGATQQFEVEAVDANDNPLEDASFLWQTSDPAVAVVDTSGLAEARAPGEATITAAAQGVPGHAGLTVAPEGTRLVFDRPPTDGVLDEPLEPVRVAVEDGAGNPVGVDGLEVSLALSENPADATLSGGATATTADGGAEFSDLSFDAWGEGFALEATADGLDRATSGPFDVELHLVQVSAGARHACGVTPADAAFCWGINTALGIGRVTPFGDPQPVPQRVLDPASGPVAWRQVGAGNDFTCGVTTSGEAYCWGTNFAGQLGDGTTEANRVPSRVADPASGAVVWADISVGDAHACGLTEDGRAFCWGTNGSGRLGDGTTTERQVPTPVSDPSDGPVTWAGLGTGFAFTCGRDTDDFVYCWGDNEFEQLSDFTTTDRFVPTPAQSLGGVHKRRADLSVGAAHVCALRPDEGSLDCWGDGRLGQLGTSGARRDFVYDGAAAGSSSTCGVTAGGEAVCWGSAPLGDGTNTGGSDPVLVSDPPDGPVTWIALSRGSGFTCGITAAGPGYCWGRNQEGQIGDGTVSTALVPARIGG